MEATPQANLEAIIRLYIDERSAIQESHFVRELTWQTGLDPTRFTEQDFLSEAAWVILCTGFKESTLRKSFNYISLCFCDWESARSIVEKADLCYATAFGVFKNHAKINAIIEIAKIVHELGFQDLAECIQIDPIATLEQLPYIGPVTAYHLAKNLGFSCAKPDRHLTRIALSLGFAHAHDLCKVISQNTSDPISLVDLILWRSAEQGRLYSLLSTA